MKQTILPSTTFAGLEAAGSCIIGDKLYDNFSLQSNATGGATPVAAGGVTYSTVDNGLAANGFNFAFILDAVANQSNDLLIGYDVTVWTGADLIASADLVVSGAAATGAGSATTVGETICPGGDIAGCVAALALSADVVPAPGVSVLDDSVNFPGVTELGVSKDINVLGGPNGVASISGITETVDQIAPGDTPEPISFVLMGAGLLGIGLLRRKA
jgi:hypothetical protein